MALQMPHKIILSARFVSAAIVSGTVQMCLGCSGPACIDINSVRGQITTAGIVGFTVLAFVLEGFRMLRQFRRVAFKVTFVERARDLSACISISRSANDC